MEHKINVIDLFAGCGGFSVGFERAGFNITKAVEFDRNIAISYSNNHSTTLMYAEDIAKIADCNHFSNGEAEVIIGGPPCQGFSMAGDRVREKKAFLSDPRNFLFRHYVEIVKIVRPKIFIIENVKGILSKDRGEIFKEIVDTFGDSNNFDGDKYFIHYKVCKAVEFGIPQKRERVVIIGTLNNNYNIDCIFSKAKESISSIDPHFFDEVTLYDAISDMPEPNEEGIVNLLQSKSYYQNNLRNKSNVVYNHTASKHNEKAIERMQNIAPGENWQVLNEDIRSVHSGAYGRLNWNNPAMTITTRFDTPAGGRFIHPDYNRTITPREAARIQSFPDSFVFVGNKTSICKQIGNAVPPKLAYFLAFVAKELLDIYEKVK